MKKSKISNLPMKAVLFARVSSREQEQGASIDAQMATIYDYCERKGLPIIKEFTIVESSIKGDRKQYKDMLDFVRHRTEKIAIIVIAWTGYKGLIKIHQHWMICGVKAR